MTKKSKKILLWGSLAILPIPIATSVAIVSCNNQSVVDPGVEPTPPPTPNPVPPSNNKKTIEMSALYNKLNAKTQGIEVSKWNMNNKAAVQVWVQAAVKTAWPIFNIKVNKVSFVKADVKNNIGVVTFSIDPPLSPNIFKIVSHPNITLRTDKKTIEVKGLKLKPNPLPQKNIINMSSLYKDINNKSKGVNQDQWNIDNPEIKNYVDSALNVASNGKVKCSNIVNVDANKESHIGSITFNVDSKLDNNFDIISNENVIIGNDRQTITINNLQLTYSTSPDHPDVKPSINLTILYSQLFEKSKNIDENNWNDKNSAISNYLTSIINDASNGNIKLSSIISIEANKNTHMGSIKFTVNKKLDDKFDIIPSNHVSIGNDRQTIIVNDLKLSFTPPTPPTPPTITATLNIGIVYNDIANVSSSFGEIEWTNTNQKLNNYLTNALSKASNDKVHLREIKDAHVDSNTHLATLSFYTKEKLSTVNISNVNEHIKIDQNHDLITIDNLFVPTATQNQINDIKAKYIPGNTLNQMRNKIVQFIASLEESISFENANFPEFSWIIGTSGELTKFEFNDSNGVLSMQYVHDQRFNINDPNYSWSQLHELIGDFNYGDDVRGKTIFTTEIDFVHKKISSHPDKLSIFVNGHEKVLPRWNWGVWIPNSLLARDTEDLNDYSLKIVVDYIKSTGDIFEAMTDGRDHLDMSSLSENEKSQVWALIDNLVQVSPQQNLYDYIKTDWPTLSFINIDFNPNNYYPNQHDLDPIEGQHPQNKGKIFINFLYCVNSGVTTSADDRISERWRVDYDFVYDEDTNTWTGYEKFRFWNRKVKDDTINVVENISTNQLINFFHTISSEHQVLSNWRQLGR